MDRAALQKARDAERRRLAIEAAKAKLTEGEGAAGLLGPITPGRVLIGGALFVGGLFLLRKVLRR
jgi:hypothetical protein